MWRGHGGVGMTCSWQNQDHTLVLLCYFLAGCLLIFLSALAGSRDDNTDLHCGREPVRGYVEGVCKRSAALAVMPCCSHLSAQSPEPASFSLIHFLSWVPPKSQVLWWRP